MPAAEAGVTRSRTRVEHAFRHSDERFCIYRNQPLILGATQWWGGSRRWTFVVSLAAFLLPQVVAAASGRMLGGKFSVTEDLQGLLSLGHTNPDGSLRVPFLRDYAAIGIAILMAAHAAHMVKQWQRVTRLPETMREGGLMPRTVVDDETFIAILDRNERRFNSVWMEVGAVIAATLAFIGIAMAMPSGVYAGLDSPIPDRARLHYELAWFNWDEHPAGFAAAVTMYSVYVYLMIRHALMGIGVLALVRDFQAASRRRASDSGTSRSRRGSRRPAPWFGYESPLVGEEVGDLLKEIRLAVNDIIISVILGVTALILGTALLTFGAPVVVALILVYASYGPTLIFLPAHLINKQLALSGARWRQETSRKWRDAAGRAQTAEGARRTQAVAEAQLARDEYEQACALPRAVVDLRELWRNVALYVVPVVALFWALIASVR